MALHRSSVRSDEYETPPMEPRHSPPKKPNTFLHMVSLLFIDILVAGLILVCFAFFHHVLPIIKANYITSTPVPTTKVTETVVTPSITPAPTAEPMEEPEATPEPTPDLRTEWQIKFADHFTDEVVVTDHSYTSPEVSINIDTVTYDGPRGQVIYYLADIYVARIENFATALADGTYKQWSRCPVLDMVEASDAIISINGDFCNYISYGFIVRNGEVYTSYHTTADICVLYRDGTMETYYNGKYTVDEILAKDPYHVWNFGPALLTAEGETPAYWNITSTVTQINPRSCVGYYEPGHYCFLVVDGRQDASKGMFLNQASELFKELGVSVAYNLDGGGSAMMTFGDEVYSHPSNGGDRQLGDILLIREYSEEEP